MAADIPKRFRRPKHWTLAQLLDHHTDKSGGPDACWLWTGGLRYGYGSLRWMGVMRPAHRLTWQEANGRPIPDGLFACHHCDNRPCVNPAHIFLGTIVDNTADRDAKGRGRWAKGEANGLAKLTEADVRAIRASTETHGAVAKRFGVSRATVSVIRNGKTWVHLL